MVPVLLVTTWFGARRLNASGIWYDEWWSLYTSGASYFGAPLSPLQVWNRIATEEPLIPPGYFELLSLWGRAAGWTEFAARALSLFLGLLAVACTFQLGRTFTRDSLVGLGAAVALGASIWFIRYLYEIRAYAFYVLLGTLFVLIYIRLKPGKWILYAGFITAGAILLYAHYFGAILFGGVGLWHLARFRRSRHWWLTLACMIAAALLFIPWVNTTIFASGLKDRVNQVDANVLQLGGEIIYVFSNTSGVLFALLAFAGLRVRNARTLWLLTGFLFILNIAGMRLLRLNELRYALSVAPFLALIVGLGVRALWNIGPGLVLALWIVAALLVEGDPGVMNIIQRFPSEPVRDMAQVVGPYLRDGDAVINVLGDGLRSTIQYTPLMFYMGDLPGRKEVVERVFLPSIPAFLDRVHQAVGDAHHVWVLYAPRWPSTEWSLFLNLLDEWDFKPCLTLSDTQDMKIIGFARVSSSQSVYHFGSGINVSLIDSPVLRGEDTLVWLGFDIQSQVPPDTYSYSIHVEDGSGTVRAQFDYGIPGAGRGCRLARINTGQLAPGTYQLKLIVYDWRTLNPLPGKAPDGTQAESLTLMQINR